jgi:membrane peptidoglycan carboxypeptidase
MDITAPVKPPEHRRRRRRGGFFLRFLGFMFAAGMIVFIAVAGAAAFVLWKVSSELPDYEVLAKYEPPVMTRIHANDGALIAEFSRERASTCRSPPFPIASSSPSSPPRTRTSISMGGSIFSASSAPSSPI